MTALWFFRQPFTFDGFLAKFSKHMEIIFLALLRHWNRMLQLWPQIVLLLRVLRHIPRAIPGLLSDNIKFSDVLGRVHSLQFQQFRHWQVFEAHLRCAFIGLRGEDKVSNGDYRIMNSKLYNITLNAKNWDRQMLPASSLVMSVLVDSIPIWIGLCPRCEVETNAMQGKSSCPKCGLEIGRAHV